MEGRLSVAVQRLPAVERCVSGLLRIQAVLAQPDGFFDRRERVGGWVRKIRPQQKHVFIELTDGSSLKGLQIVVDAAMPNFFAVAEQNVSACLRITGRLVRSPAKGQAIEMVVDDPLEHAVEVLGPNTAPGQYPMQGVALPLDFLRQHLHLRPRTAFFSAMTRVRSRMYMALHTFFQELGFVHVHTPIITASDCEGAGEMFQVGTLLKDHAPKDLPLTEAGALDYKKDFFGRPAYLTVSGQLAVENFACALTNVYTFGPTFRAEKSKTVRHLSEFWMLEPELCFAGLEELFVVIEECLKYCIKTALANCAEDMEFFNDLHKREREPKKPARAEAKQPAPAESKQPAPAESKQPAPAEAKQPAPADSFPDLREYLGGIAATPFARMTYDEAVEYLIGVERAGEHKFDVTPYWGLDLSSEHERYICERKVKGPVFLYNYPKEIKAFYMRLNDDGRTVQNTDLLLPFIGEVVGGSVREERLPELNKAYERAGLKAEDYGYYNDLRKYGTAPHAGFGIGFERLLMLITAVKNIRDTIPYPREQNSCDC